MSDDFVNLLKFDFAKTNTLTASSIVLYPKYTCPFINQLRFILYSDSEIVYDSNYLNYKSHKSLNIDLCNLSIPIGTKLVAKIIYVIDNYQFLTNDVHTSNEAIEYNPEPFNEVTLYL